MGGIHFMQRAQKSGLPGLLGISYKIVRELGCDQLDYF